MTHFLNDWRNLLGNSQAGCKTRELKPKQIDQTNHPKVLLCLGHKVNDKLLWYTQFWSNAAVRLGKLLPWLIVNLVFDFVDPLHVGAKPGLATYIEREVYAQAPVSGTG